MARALGMRRLAIAQTLLFEGAAYNLAATLLGLLAGLGLGAAIVTIINPVVARTGYPLKLTVDASSMAVAFCLGLLFTLATILLAAWTVSRMTVAAALRDLPEPPAPQPSLARLFGDAFTSTARFFVAPGMALARMGRAAPGVCDARPGAAAARGGPAPALARDAVALHLLARPLVRARRAGAAASRAGARRRHRSGAAVSSTAGAAHRGAGDAARRPADRAGRRRWAGALLGAALRHAAKRRAAALQRRNRGLLRRRGDDGPRLGASPRAESRSAAGAVRSGCSHGWGGCAMSPSSRWSIRRSSASAPGSGWRSSRWSASRWS